MPETNTSAEQKIDQLGTETTDLIRAVSVGNLDRQLIVDLLLRLKQHVNELKASYGR